MKKSIWLGATLLGASLFSAPLMAAEEVYTIDSTHTFPSYTYSHFGLSQQQHQFNNVTGTVTVDREAKTATVDVTIDMTSIETGYDVFNEHIQNEDFFHTAEHPTATFVSETVKVKGDEPVSVDGLLTIKGITKPVTLTLSHFVYMDKHPMLEVPAFGANASVQILRSDFDVDKYAPYVSDEVTINIAIEAIQQAEEAAE